MSASVTGDGAAIVAEPITKEAAEFFGQHWHSQAAVDGSYAKLWIDNQTRQLNIWEILAAAIGTYGLIKQHELLSKQVDLQERAVDQAQDYLVLAQRNYDEISVPTFNRLRDFFDICGMNEWKPRATEFLVEAFKLKDYEPQYDLARGRAMSLVNDQFDKAHLLRSRMRGRYRTGKCCSEDTMFAIATAQARIAAANAGYRYEDQKDFEIDQWYFNRLTAGAQVSMTGIANTVSGLTGGAGVATNGLNAIGNAVQTLSATTTAAGESINNLASFWGNISNGAFGMLGYGFGRSAAAGGGGVFGSSIQQGFSSASPFTQPQAMLGGGMHGGMGGSSGYASAGALNTGAPMNITPLPSNMGFNTGGLW